MTAAALLHAIANAGDGATAVRIIEAELAQTFANGQRSALTEVRGLLGDLDDEDLADTIDARLADLDR